MLASGRYVGAEEAEVPFAEKMLSLTAQLEAQLGKRSLGEGYSRKSEEHGNWRRSGGLGRQSKRRKFCNRLLQNLILLFPATEND